MMQTNKNRFIPIVIVWLISMLFLSVGIGCSMTNDSNSESSSNMEIPEETISETIVDDSENFESEESELYSSYESVIESENQSETLSENQSEESETESETEIESETQTESERESENENESENETPIEDTIMITAPVGEVFPYVNAAKAYLQAGEGADVANYFRLMDNAYAPIQVEWEYEGENVSTFIVRYATKADFSNAILVEVSSSKRSIDLYNLYRGTTYYVSVEALNFEGETLDLAESEFQTTSLGPRVMNIDAIHNVRDLGGYETSFGKTIVQGIAYRGGSLTPPPKDIYTSNLTDEGKRYMSEVMGIKAELDFRNAEESGVSGGSVIPGATLTYITVGGYSAAFTSKEGYRKIFSYLADENNYPLYYHCTGGADRTGTVTFLLHALLGVSELECIQGYEFTSFSTYNIRNAHSGDWANNYFQPFLTTLKSYPGNSLQEKTENYLLSIGVTETEIYNIKAIFFGEPTKATIYAPTSYIKNVDGDLVLSLVGKKNPSKVYLGNVETDFTYSNGKIIITPEQLPSLPDGNTFGKVVFNDGTETEFTLDWKELNIVTMNQIFAFNEQGEVKLTANRTPLESTGTIGYGKTALVKMQTTTVTNTEGGLRVFIGSYGFECRGGEIRPYTIDANGTMKEVTRNAGMHLPNTMFNGGATLYMTVKIINNKPVLTIKVENGNSTYEHTYVFPSRIANEIPETNMKMTFWIRTDAVTSLTIYA